ncbi:MAG: MlaD family protein [Endozoicomonadaceae bacterium]|nr:MlaD family protein [Endozoicomonadaceae bacterium]
MSDETSSQEVIKPQVPVLKKTYTVFFIWTLLIVTLLLFLLIFWKQNKNNTIDVTVRFDNAQGIIAGKTDVIYNGIVIGHVSHVQFTDNLKTVAVTLTIDDKFKPWLTDKTAFWLVKPTVNLSGITGLETLVSGNYIAIKPNDQGKPATLFTALNQPLVESNAADLRLTLIAESLHSLNHGSPVYFRQIKVGEVINYSLLPHNDTVRVDIIIFSEYKHLVRYNSRFWNVSGFKLSASLKGIKVETESVTSLLKGGIAFYTPEWETPGKQITATNQFVLYPNFEDAQTGVVVNVRFPLHDRVIHKNTRIMFHELKVGFVRRVDIESDLRHFNIEAVIDPDAQKLLVDGATFQIIQPKFNLSDISNLNLLLSDPYVAINVAQEAIKKGITKKQFYGTNNNQTIPVKLPGLNLILTTPSLRGLQVNSSIFFREQKIGSVTFIQLSSDKKNVLVYVNIKPEYTAVINQSSAFINISGLNVTAGLSGIQFHTTHLMNVITGGIKIINIDDNAPNIDRNKIIPLHDNEQTVQKGLRVSLITHNARSIKAGTPVLYLGIPVGEVTNCRLDNPANHVIIDIIIKSPYNFLVTKNSKFWSISGIKIEGGLLSGITLKSQSLQTVITGGIAFATPYSSIQVEEGSRFILHARAKDEWKQWHPAIKLNS